MKIRFFLFFFIIFASFNVSALDECSGGYNFCLSRAIANNIYCQQNGSCVLQNLTVVNFTNLTISNVHINLTKLFIDGNLNMLEFSIFNATDMNGSKGNFNNITVTQRLSVGIDPPISTVHIYENTDNTGATAGVTIENDGTSGDAIVQFLLTAEKVWVEGIDNTDNNYKISPSRDLGTNPYFIIDDSNGLFNFTDKDLRSINSIKAIKNIETTDGNISTTHEFHGAVGDKENLTFSVGTAPFESGFYINGIFNNNMIFMTAGNKKFGHNGSSGDFEAYNDIHGFADLLINSQFALGGDSVISADRLMDLDNSKGLTSANSFGAVYTPKKFANGGSITALAFRGDVAAGFAVVTSNGARILNPAVGGGGSLTNAVGLLIDSITAGSASNKAILTNDGLVDFGDDIIGRKNLNITEKIIAENVFLPQEIFLHTNETIDLDVANQWFNMSFDHHADLVKRGITHTFDDETNDTITINQSGNYWIHYSGSFIDTSASPTANFGLRLIRNGVEVMGSVVETDASRQDAEDEIEQGIIALLTKGDKIKLQAIADDTDVSITTHGTFGDEPESTTISIFKISNP